jgi:hypothetical protein
MNQIALNMTDVEQQAIEYLIEENRVCGNRSAVAACGLQMTSVVG